MELSEGFFSNEQTKITIQRYLSRFDAIEPVNEFEKERNKYIKLILNSMIDNPNEWNVNGSINIAWIADSFTTRLVEISSLGDKESIDDIFSICYRFLLEYYLSIKNNLSIEFEQARIFATNNLEEFTGNAKTQIEYVHRDMPIAVLKQLINHDNIDSIKKFNNTIEKAEKMKNEWDKELEDKTIEVQLLKENLEKYKVAFNFVGLFQGFDDLASDKQNEKARILVYLIIIGSLIILPVLLEITYVIFNIDHFIKFDFSLIALIVPTITLIGILVYYFRILLFNYNSVKSQLLQLDLRKTLCRFIQNYVEYSVEIKKKDKDALALFEKVVFSGLVTSDDKLPGTFDGIEQLAALIKSVKSS